ncbi:MAG: hypothetical protein JWM83_2213 [Candidatus Angelobacter sp.]|nr:hypothetical protein [Candidatus Angelobacter sp.]
MIREQNEAEKRGRPFGDRSVEVGLGLCLQQNHYPRVGYVEEKQFLVLSF